MSGTSDERLEQTPTAEVQGLRGATAAGGAGSMYCIAGDPDPALHSQLGKTDGEVTNLVSCDTSVLYTRSPHSRSAGGGPPF